MPRRRVTVEDGYLPGQVFEHERDGVYCVVRDISGRPPDIPVEQVLEALDLQLSRWREAGGDAQGVPVNLLEHADSFRLLRPELGKRDVWPARPLLQGLRHALLLGMVREDQSP